MLKGSLEMKLVNHPRGPGSGSFSSWASDEPTVLTSGSQSDEDMELTLSPTCFLTRRHFETLNGYCSVLPTQKTHTASLYRLYVTTRSDELQEGLGALILQMRNSVLKKIFQLFSHISWHRKAKTLPPWEFLQRLCCNLFLATEQINKYSEGGLDGGLQRPHLLCSSWSLATLAPSFFPFDKSFKFISLWQVFQHPLARWQLALLGEPLAPRPEKAGNDDLERPPSTGRRPRQHEGDCAQSGLTMKCQIGPRGHCLIFEVLPLWPHGEALWGLLFHFRLEMHGDRVIRRDAWYKVRRWEA